MIDCIQNTTAVCNPRQNSAQDKIQSEKISEKGFLSEEKNCREK